MTYQPNMGHQQQPAAPPPPRRRRPAMLIAIALAVLVAAGGVLIIVLTTSGGNTSQLIGAPGSSSATAPTPGSDLPNATGTAPKSSRPLPPPTPTGRLSKTDDLKIGDCADLARRPTGITIYQATCDDPAATLILESILAENEKCPGLGFFGLKTLSKKIMCFTHNFKAGECVDMQIPRRAACADPTAPTGGKPVVTVAEIRLGQQDGTGCANTPLILQVGKGNERGVACMIGDSKQNTSAQPSR